MNYLTRLSMLKNEIHLVLFNGTLNISNYTESNYRIISE
jgi:hypothetical protein